MGLIGLRAPSRAYGLCTRTGVNSVVTTARYPRRRGGRSSFGVSFLAPPAPQYAGGALYLARTNRKLLHPLPRHQRALRLFLKCEHGDVVADIGGLLAIGDDDPALSAARHAAASSRS